MCLGTKFAERGKVHEQRPGRVWAGDIAGTCRCLSALPCNGEKAIMRDKEQEAQGKSRRCELH